MERINEYWLYPWIICPSISSSKLSSTTLSSPTFENPTAFNFNRITHFSISGAVHNHQEVSQWKCIATIFFNSIFFDVRWTNDRRTTVTRTRWGRNRVPCSCCSACCCRDWCAPSHPAKVSKLPSRSLSWRQNAVVREGTETLQLESRFLSIQEPDCDSRWLQWSSTLRTSSFTTETGNECSRPRRSFDKLGNGRTCSERQPPFCYFLLISRGQLVRR